MAQYVLETRGLVKRFYRADSARSGNGESAVHYGLGLAIASDIAVAHDGTLELSNRIDEGGNVLGARVEVRLSL